MVELFTNKSTREVIIRPLDGSGRKFILFGLQRERLEFDIRSPTKHTLGHTHISQQRTVGRRKFTLSFAVFEPTVLYGRPDRSGIHEDRADHRAISAREQLELVHALAKLHEDGILLSYDGIALTSERVAITEFNADVIYATGTGTITLEERTKKPIDIESINISIDAIEAALRELEKNEPSQPDQNSAEVIDAFLLDPTNSKDYILTVQAFQAEVLGQDSFTPFLPTDDPKTLANYGLQDWPLVCYAKGEDGDVQIFPDDPTFRKPKLRILPLKTPASAAAGFSQTASVPFNISVATQGLFIDFRFTKIPPPRMWEVTAWVFSDVPPLFDQRADAKPITDPRVDQAKVAPEKEPDPRNSAFKPENKGKFKDLPRHVITANVAFGTETQLADLLTFAFVPLDGQPRPRPKNKEIGDWALVIADYRENAA